MLKYRTLEDVLEAYAVETPNGNDAAVLNRWMKDYPAFADDLMDFAAGRSMARHLPDPVIPENEMAGYRESGLSMLREITGTDKKKLFSISSLSEMAKESGLNKTAFASALEISVSLLMQLDKRYLIASSIPRRLIGRIAESLKTTEESVAAYLSGGPEFSAQASYKAESRPEKQDQKDFTKAVMDDPSLSEEQKNKLINLA